MHQIWILDNTSYFSKLENFGLRNNSKNHGLLIYNRVPKTASSTMVEIINGLSSKNNFTFWHIPIRHYYNTTLRAESSFLWHHYYKDPWPLLTDQHIMFVNAVEHHNIQGASKVIIQIWNHAQWDTIWPIEIVLELFSFIL